MEQIYEPITKPSVAAAPLEKTNLNRAIVTPEKPSYQSVAHFFVQPRKSPDKSPAKKDQGRKNRPKWIPDHIGDNFDTDPYAYQTEEDLMPGGQPHGETLGDIWELTHKWLRKNGMMLWMDTFLLYLDEEGEQDRVGPDLMIVPGTSKTRKLSSYNVQTNPTPLCCFEIVSPSSIDKDKDAHNLYINHLGIPLSVVIQRVDANGDLLNNAILTVWRKDQKTGQAVQMKPDPNGRYLLKELGLFIGLQGQSVYFVDNQTDHVLRDIESERQRALQAEQALEAEKQAHEAEKQA